MSHPSPWQRCHTPSPVRCHTLHLKYVTPFTLVRCHSLPSERRHTHPSPSALGNKRALLTFLSLIVVFSLNDLEPLGSSCVFHLERDSPLNGFLWDLVIHAVPHICLCPRSQPTDVLIGEVNPQPRNLGQNYGFSFAFLMQPQNCLLFLNLLLRYQ